MSTRPASSWTRPKEGRWIAGVCGALAARLGASPGLWRSAFAIAAVAGVALAVFYAIFDIATFGEPAANATRWTAIGGGLLAALAYPVLALLLPGGERQRRWDFASAGLVVFLLLLVGQALGVLLAPYWETAKAAWMSRGASGWFTWFGDYHEIYGFGVKDVVLGAFFVSAGGFVWIQRDAVKRFFRSMHTGVTLVVMTTLAVTLGVLIPQIDGFEDPDQRVDLTKEYADYELFKKVGYQKLPSNLMDGHEQYQAFRWAEGYFLYHVLHLYGIGMPAAVIPPQAEEGLEAFGRKYGIEERDNRRKQMTAAFQGQAKVAEIATLLHTNEDAFWRFFEVSTLLDWNRTYKSHWFAMLLTLLGVAVAFNTFRAQPARLLSVKKLGFVVVHMGVMILLGGGLVSKLFTDRGLLTLFLDGQAQDTYARHFDPRKPARMPFHVRLDHFSRKDWPALEVVFFDEQFSSRVPRYTLWQDREIELDFAEDAEGNVRPNLRLRVLDLHDRTEIGLPNVAEAATPEEGRVPLVEFLATDAHLMPGHQHEEGPDHDHTRRAYLFPMDRVPQPYVDPGRAFRIGAVHDGDPSAFMPDSGVPTIGYVEVTVTTADNPAPRLYPVQLGQEIEVAGGFRLRFADASADFGEGRGDRQGSTHSLPLAQQPDGFAAAWIDVLPPNGATPERRIVMEDIDDVEHGLQREHTYTEVVLRLRWDDWRAPGPPRYVLQWGEGREPKLYSEDGGEWPVVAGEPLPLPGTNPIVPLQFLNHATFEKNLTFLPPEERGDGWDADFYSPTPVGLQLEVTRYPDTDREVVETVSMATTEFAESDKWFSGDETFAILFLENREMLPYEWRSVLTILERDNAGNLYEVPLGTEKDREIRVNDYFTYKGYRFFQTDARAEQPDYSGIGVVYDPGIPLVLIGMYTIIAGAVIAFLVKPIRLGWERVAKA